jgi:lipoprotein
MKKLLSLGFLSLSVVALVACSQGKNSSSETSSTSEVKQETVESSKSTEASSKTDDKLPRVSADQMASFIDYFKQDLTDKGVDISTYTFYNKDTILYVKVPNEYKYYPKTDLQAFADGLKTKEHEAFNVWAATNEVDFNSYPMLHIKTDDGDSLVSQKLNGNMEVKVK